MASKIRSRNPHDSELIANVLNAINSAMMERNELNLARDNVAVNFDSSGSMAERMDGLLSALARGFDFLGLTPLVAALGVFPIRDASDVCRPAMLFYSRQVGEARPRFGRTYVSSKDPRDQYECSDQEMLSNFVLKLRRLCEDTDADDEEVDVISAPYFVRQFSQTTSFDMDSQLFSKIYHCGSLQTPTWPWVSEAEASGDYVQRLILFLLVPKGHHHNNRSIEKTSAICSNGLRNALGAFLSSAGVNAEENKILFAQRVAAHALLRVHEIPNDTFFLLGLDADLERALAEGRSHEDVARIIADYRANFRSYSEKVRRLQGVVAADLEAFEWRQMTRIVRGWCAGRGWKEAGRNRWRITGVRGGEMRVDFDSVRQDVLVSFVPDYLGRLLDILTNNTLDAWKAEDWRQAKTIELQARHQNGAVIVFHRSTGPGIPESIIARLFREPIIREDQGRGTGLWAIGLAFSSHGLPYPMARNTPVRGTSGIEFEMRFRASRN